MRYFALILLLSLFGVGMIVGPHPTRKPGNGIAEALAVWGPDWLWGLAAIDHNGDGWTDLCVTDHNGGSIILENNGDGTFQLAPIGGNTLGGSFRPAVMDFDGDQLPDLLYRDSKANTAYRNTGEGFAPVGFAYGTSNDPIRQSGVGWFGHDWGRWNWNGSTFTPSNYTNPAYGKISQPVRDKLNGDFGKQFYRAWFNETQDLTAVTGWFGYHAGANYCHFFWNRRGQWLDVSNRFGLPTDGAVVHLDSELALIVGHGAYVRNGNRFVKLDGALTDFLAVRGDAPHQVFHADDWLVVNNVRGRVTKVFDASFGLVASVGSWDGEPVAIGDFNGDGKADVAVGSGMDIVFVWGQ